MNPILIAAASLLAEIEWRERFGFDIDDLVFEYEALLGRYALEAVWQRLEGMRALPKESFV